MTRKHFEALAREIAKLAGNQARFDAANAVINACRQFNPALDTARFMKACGVSA